LKIKGFFDERYKPPAPFIKAIVESQKLKIRKIVYFHIDTGASLTIILDKDVKYLGINVNTLRKAGRQIGGIGGFINTYQIEDAKLLFITEDQKIIEEKLVLHVGIHDPTKLSPEEKEMIMRIPSLLGRDIIHRFKLAYNKPKNEIYLEKPNLSDAGLADLRFYSMVFNLAMAPFPFQLALSAA